MAAIICIISATYISIGVFGVVLIVQGLKAVIRRQITITRNTFRVTINGISVHHQPVSVVGDRAVKWGIVRIISGLLAAVPWLIPMIWPMPLTTVFWLTPFAGLLLHFAASQTVRE